MRLVLDKKSNALYFRLDENAIIESEEVQPGVILDYDKNGRVVGVEFLDVMSRVKEKDLANLQFQTE